MILLVSQIDGGGRIALVAPAPERDGRMVAEAQDFLAHIGQIHGRRHVDCSSRLRPLSLRVGLEKFVPDHDAILVAQVVEVLAGALADPVADDGVVGVAVQADLRLEAFARDALHRLVHAPVAALAMTRHAVDGEREVVGCRHVVGDFADAEVQVLLRRRPRQSMSKLQVQRIKIRGSIAIGPPEVRMYHVQLRRCRRR